MYDKALAYGWWLGCLVAGPALIFGGARAAGSALLGSVVGSVAGLGLRELSGSVPYAAVVGGSVGTVVFGFAGLVWRPAGPVARNLNARALATAIIGALVVLGVHAADQTCYGVAWEPQASYSWCFPRFGRWAQALIAFDVVFLALLFLLQVPPSSNAQPRRPTAPSAPRDDPARFE
jgi:hypothetical protein